MHCLTDGVVEQLSTTTEKCWRGGANSEDALSVLLKVVNLFGRGGRRHRSSRNKLPFVVLNKVGLPKGENWSWWFWGGDRRSRVDVKKIGDGVGGAGATQMIKKDGRMGKGARRGHTTGRVRPTFCKL